MNRYTLRARVDGEALQWSLVKKAAEQEFLYAGKPITFRWGRAQQTDGALAVEIATDVDREALLSLVRPLESRFPVQFDSIGWGWPLTDATLPDPSDALAIDRTGDHYAFAVPQQEPVRVYTYGPRQMLRLIEWVGFLLFAGSVVWVAIFHVVAFPWIEDHDYIFLFVWALYWFLSHFFQTQLFPLVFVSSIRCDEHGIEIKYWLRAPRRLSWPEVTELDMSFDQGTLRSRTEALSFTIGEPMGLAEDRVLVKTILARAGLHFVGYMGRKGAVHKRFDGD